MAFIGDIPGEIMHISFLYIVITDTDTSNSYRPIPKPIPIMDFSFRQNRYIGRYRYYRPIADTNSVSVVPYVLSTSFTFLFILGMFIGFSMTGAVSWILKYFKDYK